MQTAKSCRGLFNRAAQIGPIDIRPELFAGDGTARSSLDSRTAPCRHWSPGRNPLAHRRRANPERASEQAGTPNNSARSGNRLFHTAYTKALPNSGQEALPNRRLLRSN